jgi:Beta-galactosidase
MGCRLFTLCALGALFISITAAVAIAKPATRKNDLQMKSVAVTTSGENTQVIVVVRNLSKAKSSRSSVTLRWAAVKSTKNLQPLARKSLKAVQGKRTTRVTFTLSRSQTKQTGWLRACVTFKRANVDPAKQITGTEGDVATTTEGNTKSDPVVNITHKGVVFALLDPGERDASPYLQMPDVDGVAFRARWTDIEPQSGALNTSGLDSIIAQAAAVNKHVTVHIGVSGGGAPSWLASQGAQTFTANSPRGTVTDYVPWDATLLQAYASFVSRLGSKYQNSDTVTRFSVGAPISEMTILGCANNTMGTTTYSRSRYLDAWNASYKAARDAFPSDTLLVSLPMPFICFNDSDGAPFARDLGLELDSNTSWFAADLRSDGSQRTAQLPAGMSIAYQAIWSVTGDTSARAGSSLQALTCTGWKAGARYVELYKADLMSNPERDAALATARQGC